MEKTLPPLWIPDQVVAETLSHADAKAAVRDCLACHQRGDFVQPLKPYIRPRGRDGEHDGGRFIAMPAYLGGPFDMAGLKWIAGFPGNVERGLTRASGTVQLNCTRTGRLLAVMECQTLSARRTAAVAALAVELLAAPVALRLAVIGAGPIGRTVLEAMAGNDRLFDVRLCDQRPQRAEAIAATVVGLPPVRCTASPQEAVHGANVIVCATTGASGYLRPEWLSPGWLVVALSLDDATPELFLSADRVIVDDFDQSCREEKLLHRLVRDGRFSRERVAAELGEVIAGVKIGRTWLGENIYLNPMGLAIEDIAVGTIAYRKAVALGLGQPLS